MKTSLIVGTFLLAGAGASSLGALPNPYQGSDTLNALTVQVLANLGLAPNYIGGGSGNGQSAMVAGTQVSAPMSRMMNSGAALCTKTTTEAQGIVIGLDSVDVLASIVTGGSAACNGANEGLVQSGSITANGTTVTFANWKTVLALVYGGEADPANPGQTICNGPKRAALVSNWSNLFQDSCANGAAATCGDTTHQTCTVTRGLGSVGTCTQPATIPLWHAFRRDDQSGTSDVFATLLGLSPSTSATANNGFGASPYCNAMNWETGNGNGTTCALGMNKQFTGPGGVYNSLSGEAVGAQIHRRPPPNAWGDFPDTQTNTFTDADVTATSMQDNDPIRRPCVGTAVGLATKEAEEVCNIDNVSVGGKTVGQLGLVVAVPDAIYIQRDLGLNLFPTNQCGGAFLSGDSPQTYNCAPNKATKHAAQCPNGDSDVAGTCQWPSDNSTATVTTGCENTFSNAAGIVSPRNFAGGDGRSFNLWYTDQRGVDGSVKLTQQLYTLAKAGGGTSTVSIDSAQGMGRMHITSTIPARLVGCKNPSATDQIGCFAQADQCSIGFSGDAAKSWGTRQTPAIASNNAAILVDDVAPTTQSVQLLGQAGEYPLSRKLYFNTLEGWTTVQAGGATNADELTIAKNESSGAFINSFLTSNGFFTLGSQSPQGTDSPFCEDFNQQTVCAAASNDNACSRNAGTGVVGESAASTAKPVQSTVCGDGFVGAYEECDHGASNGVSGNSCLATCRCAVTFPCQ